MKPFSLILLVALALPGLALAAPTAPDHAAGMARSLALFKSDILPLLKRNCNDCHGGEKIRAGLNLNTREGLLKGGDTGPAAIPGNSSDSLLIALIEHRQEPFMPKSDEKFLDAEQIAIFARWINTGAAYTGPILDPEQAAASDGPMIVTDEDRDFWSFRPLANPVPPQQYNASWSRGAIDDFIAEKHESEGISPSPEASPEKLLRRIHFDLTGLSPTLNELNDFEAALRSPQGKERAYEDLVDSLLASPRFGEKWARHWLDVARFAESHGFEQDYDRPYAYHYRDFVIRAFNEDVPYDRFVKWQIAGDELAPNESLARTATGFLGAGVFPTQLTEKEFESARYDELDDMAATTGTAFLGLTIGCARCHDHKYDPIPVNDYYRLLSTFTTTIRSEIFLPADPAAAARELASWEAKQTSLTSALEKAEFEADRKKAAADLKKHLDAKPPPGTAMVQVTGEGYPKTKHHADARGFPHFYPETFHLTRGDVLQKGEVAEPGFLQVLLREDASESRWRVEPPEGARYSGRRTALANWITDTELGAGHLLARVIVNRLWHHHFGRGLVATPSDFGLQGARPTHPELLDYLAGELIENGWRLKPIHKQILLSATWRQAATPNPAFAKVDPDNRYLWRFTPRRLEAESLRDSLLALGGRLDTTMYGPGSLDAGSPRRSIYLFIKRSELIPMMQVFDTPEPLVGQGSRPSTTISHQALVIMNNSDVRAWIDGFAARLDEAAPDSLEKAVTRAYRIALGRAPTPTEHQQATAFLEDQLIDYKHAARPDARLHALGDFCQILVSLNEFAFIE